MFLSGHSEVNWIASSLKYTWNIDTLLRVHALLIVSFGLFGCSCNMLLINYENFSLIDDNVSGSLCPFKNLSILYIV